MATAEDIIKIARAEIGTTEYPANSNKVKYNTWYYGKEVSGSAYPWCAAFQSYVFNKVDASLMKKSALCMDIGNWFKTNKQWYTTPQVGDLVFFKFGTNARWTNHIGLVSEVNSDGSIMSIEGNTSVNSDDNGGAVMERKRTSWVGFGRPKYSSSKTVTTTTLPSNNYTYGIDVSSYQGDIDWKQVKDFGIKFAILRTVLRTGEIDPTFERNYLGATKQGIEVATYIYSYATNEVDAQIEANRVVNLLGNRKCCIWYDLEWNEQASKGKSTITKIINAFENIVKGKGFDCQIYCNMNWYNNYIDDSIKSTHKFWIARYPMGDNGTIQERLNPKNDVNNIMMWQYSSKGKVPGIKGNVDMDIMYNNLTSKVELKNEYERIIYIDANTLNIRQEPNLTAIIKSELKRGQCVEIVANIGGWYRMKSGFYFSSNSKYSHEAFGEVFNCTALNARSTPNASDKSNILFSLRNGDKVRPIKYDGDWLCVGLSNGTHCWVNKKYIRLY